ncbi:PAS domain-containing protein [Polyangium jinanense]|uniref:PAS domain-containing protein n=1 Tax=Polyangium jinanense TaxID=2829994 RepID=A0A9X3X391_9BACT|nr:PAS domain-containing protein [Polyangium jinanense]MDC3954074.1 PAS domain-containing protein [Polyangium jinanense]MDC3981970.1 PAS domain-containing protein [Polyangium jinanense]
MSKEEVDDLPYGFVVLDEVGTILLYNRYESSLSRLPSERVVGKNWFKEVAPCTRVEAFYGRFRALVQDEARLSESFRFRFHFMHGTQDVAVQLVKAPPVVTLPLVQEGTAARIFMTVVRRPVVEVGANQAGHDWQKSLGTIGGLLPVLLDALPALLERLGPRGAIELGEHVGRAMALVIESEADTHAREGGRAPVLAPGALDGVLARAGLGRVAIEGAAWSEQKRIHCELRPPFEVEAAETALFYGALLSAAIGSGLGEPCQASFAENRKPHEMPWLVDVCPATSGERRSELTSSPF